MSGSKNSRFKKTVILVEHENHVKDCLKLLKKIKGQKLVIALSPFAAYELDKQNLPYKIIEDYYDPKELYKLGLNNYKKVKEICDIIDKKIRSACPIMAELGIAPALFNFRHLKNIYDAVTIRLFQLSKMINAEKPNVLCHYESKRYPYGIPGVTPYLFFDNRESIFAHILACGGWDVSITRLPHVEQPWENAQKRPKALVRHWLYKYPELLDLTLVARRQGWREALKIVGKSSPNNFKVIFFGAGYDWEECRKELQSVGIDPVFVRILDKWEHWLKSFPKEINTDALRKGYKELLQDNKFLSFFRWRDIDFLPILEARLRFLVERLTPACLAAYEEAADLIQRRKIRAIISPTLLSCTGHSVARAARNNNVPVVTWQEGSYGYFDQPMIPYELISSDVHFVYGSGVVNKYANVVKRYGARIVSIGSSSLEALFKNRPPTKVRKIVKLDPNKKVVVYATTNFYQNTLYVATFPPFSDNSFWRVQREILNVLGKNDKYTSIVKIHPSRAYREPPMRAYAEEKELKNCRFIRDECTFAELLPIADLFVIDYPTTTLLEALTTTKPVFVYTGHLRVDTKARKLLERRAFFYQELKSLTNALDLYLSTGKIDKRVNLRDKEFLKAYGISWRGEGSGMRAAKMLKKIISREA